MTDQRATVDYVRAKKEMKRTIHMLEKLVAKKLSKYTDTTFFIGVGYTHETKHALQTSWEIASDAPVLSRKLHEYIPALEAALVTANDTQTSDPAWWLLCPKNAEKRAEKVRHMLRLAWASHVRGSPCQGKKQMYILVQQGKHPGFPWWETVADVPFTNTALESPEVSQLVFDYLAPRMSEFLH